MDPAEEFYRNIKGNLGSFKLVVILVVLIVLMISGTFIIPPGHRGILITMGKVSPVFAPEGFGFKLPFVTTVMPVSVRQQSVSAKSECYSSDLQQINVELRILYRIPENGVVTVFRDYYGDPFDSLISPRVSEALKEVTALQSAEQIVKKREEIKARTLEGARKKVGDLLVIEDVVIQNVALSKELETAIEAKMVQEQEAAKAKFTQVKTEIEAQTAVIRAKGEAEAIRVRGRAVQENPGLVQLQIVEKWNGISPLVVGGGSGANILLPVEGLKSR
ncbi:MAG: prohibitin family protein [Bdellovibrionales bacterium]|nr:prohibitin family protein [Bdellovibrionales bacterium]